MKRFVMLLLTATALIGMSDKIKAQGEAAVPFLLLAPDSRAGGIGETGTGLADNSAAIFWNPAGIAFLDGTEFSITHSNWLPAFNLDLFYDYLTFRTYYDEIGGSLTGSITYMNYGEFVRTNSGGQETGTFRSYDAAFTVGYAAKLSQDWGLGLNFRFIHSRLADKPTEYEQGEGVANTVSFDVAAMWRPKDLYIPFLGEAGNRLSIGANLSNMGPKIYYIDQEQADPIPTNFRLGFAVVPFADDFNSLTLTLDFSKLLVEKGKAYRGEDAEEEDDTPQDNKDRADFYEAIFTAWADDPMSEELRDINTSFGAEYWYGDPSEFMFALRAGMFYEDPSYGNRKFVTMGAGLRYDMYGFDFSYLITDVFDGGENHPLKDTLRFTLLIGWGAPTRTTNGLPRGI